MTEHKILFLVEPYVIRESPTTYQWIAEQYLKVASSNPQTCRVLCNAATADAVIQDNLAKSIVFTPTQEEQHVFLQGGVPRWDDHQVKRWRDHMLGIASHSDKYQNMLYRVRDDFPFDAVVFWGTNRIVTDFCGKTGVIPFFSELGPIRAPFGQTSCIDTLGVNGDALPAFLDISDLDSIHRPDVSFMHQSKSPYVLIPLQNADDANVLVHGDGTEYEDFLTNAVQESLQNGLKPIIKTHPGAKCNAYTYSKEVSTVDRLRKMGAEVLDTRTSGEQTASLLRSAHSVLTFNSSVGFEASQLGVPVHVNGRAVYKVGGVFPSLSDVCRSEFDRISYVDSTIRLGAFMRKYLFQLDAAFSLRTIDFLINENLAKGNDSPASVIKGRRVNSNFNFAKKTDAKFSFKSIVDHRKRLLIIVVTQERRNLFIESLPSIEKVYASKIFDEIIVLDRSIDATIQDDIPWTILSECYKYRSVYDNEILIDIVKSISKEYDYSTISIGEIGINFLDINNEMIGFVFEEDYTISLVNHCFGSKACLLDVLIIDGILISIRGSFFESIADLRISADSVLQILTELHYEATKRGTKCAIVHVNNQLELSNLKGENTHLKNQLSLIFRSKSWRITAPLRATQRLFTSIYKYLIRSSH